MTNYMFKNVLKVHMITFLILNNYTFVFKRCHYLKQICLNSVVMLYLPSHLLLSFAFPILLLSLFPPYLFPRPQPPPLPSLPFAPLCLVLIRRRTSNLLKVIRNT